MDWEIIFFNFSIEVVCFQVSCEEKSPVKFYLHLH